MTDAEPQQAIRWVIARWLEASAAGDLGALSSLMTDDVLFLTPGQPPMDKTRFLEVSAENLGKIRLEGVAEVREVEVAGGWAYAHTHLRITARLESGQAVVRSGPALSVFRRGSGGWQIHRDANMLAVER